MIEWAQSLPYWPVAQSAYAADVDRVFLAFLLVLLLFTVPVFVFATLFLIRYRHGSPASRKGRPKGSPWLETAWSAIPLAIMLIFYVQAARSYIGLHTATEGALRIEAVGKQWMWKFQHPNGRRQINQLNVPVDTPIEVHMISEDVIHSLFLPSLRIKQDVLPNRYTTLRFTADKTGTNHLTCAEYCGTAHARMGGSIVVMAQADYDAWVAEEPAFEAPARTGEALYHQNDCDGCHSPGSPVPAPGLAGLYDAAVPLGDGSVRRADDTYLRESMLRPNAATRRGYEGVMPSYEGQLDEEAIFNLIAYIRSLDAATAARAGDIGG